MGIATGAFLIERDEWPSALRRARREQWRAAELTAITEALFDSLAVYLAGTDVPLSRFDRVSVHAPALFHSSASSVAQDIPSLLRGYDLIFHPDVYRHELSLAALGERAVFENIDLNKSFGRTVLDLAEVFRRFPSAGFCLDVAHVWTNDRSLRLGGELLDSFGDRLRQIRLSGIEADGTHRLPTTEADLALYEPLLDRCSHVPWVLESELVTERSSA